MTLNQQSLLLNGQQIYPSGRQTSRIRTYQIQTNASKELLAKIGDFGMLDDAWRLRTRFGTYGISFDETVQSTRNSRRTYLSFDIIGISYSHNTSRHNFLLEDLHQQTIQLVLEQEPHRRRLQIKDIQLHDRCEARLKGTSQTCRSIQSSLPSFDKIHRVSFRDWDWDEYGKIGTFMHSWNSFWWNIDRHPVLFVLFVVCIFFTFRKMSTQVHRRGLRYLRRSNGDLEETRIDETEPKNLYLDQERI